MPKEKNYHKRKFSPNRMILADYNNVAASLNRVFALMEIDVTNGLAKIEEIEKKEGYKVSITAWAVKCLSQVVVENKQLNTFRKGRKLVVFDEVDISVIIEITTKTGKKIPYNYVVRNADTKSVKMITDEIRSYQSKKITEKEQLKRERATFIKFYTLVPKFIRRFVIRKMITNPFRLKKLIGTVGITSLGMYIKGLGGYMVPFSDKSLNVALGGIKDQAVVRNGKLEERKYLFTTFLIDHDIVDVARGVSSIARFAELMDDSSYLEDLEKI